MAHWKNPETRKIGKHIYHLVGQGMQKKEASRRVKAIRENGSLARVVVDERLGRHDIESRDNFYCLCVKRRG